MNLLRGKCLWVAGCLLLFSVTGSDLAGQERGGVAVGSSDTNYAPYNQIFHDYELTPEGVVAYDSLGNPWTWDFEAEAFAEGNLIGTGGVRAGADRGGPRAADVPVEVRCLEEKIILRGDDPINIDYDEFVDDNINASGKVTVSGWVKGDIRAFDRVLITESGQVDGYVKAPEIRIKTGGKILGDIRETGSLINLPDEVMQYSSSVGGIWILAVFTAIFVVAGFLILTLMPVRMENLSACLIRYPARCYLLGWLFTMLMPMIVILALITIVGPIVVTVAYLGAFVIGIVGMCQSVGARFMNRCVGGHRADMINYLIGLSFLVMLWLITVSLLGSSSDTVYGFGVFFLVLSILLTSLPIMAGAGASFLTRFGSRKYMAFRDQSTQFPLETRTPAPPPIPDKPSAMPVGQPVPGDQRLEKPAKDTIVAPQRPVDGPPAVTPPESHSDDAEPL